VLFCGEESVGFVGLMLAEYERFYTEPGDTFQKVVMREIEPFLGIKSNPNVKRDLICTLGRILISSYVHNAVHGNTFDLEFHVGDSVLSVSPTPNEDNILTVEIINARKQLDKELN
jgi:hypothetical protein